MLEQNSDCNVFSYEISVWALGHETLSFLEILWKYNTTMKKKSTALWNLKGIRKVITFQNANKITHYNYTRSERLTVTP